MNTLIIQVLLQYIAYMQPITRISTYFVMRNYSTQ